MTKVLIFDFWGTLVDQGVRSPIKQVKRLLYIKVPFSEYVVRMERAMMTEKFSLEEAFKNVCKEFQIQPNNRIIEELIGMWNKNWMLAKIFPETKEVLEELSTKYQLVLVANTDAFSVKNVLEKYDLEKYFTKSFFSHDIHMIKTDKPFLKHVVDDLQVAVQDCIVIGDSVHSDMVAAERVGMKSILVDRRNTRDFAPKVETLKELKL